MCRLHPDDASQVDVIHTDARIAGTFNLLGHMDFFPNGGTNQQPGCGSCNEYLPYSSQSNKFKHFRLFLDSSGCSHGIACDFFTESINNDCFVSTHTDCTDVEDMPVILKVSKHPYNHRVIIGSCSDIPFSF